MQKITKNTEEARDLVVGPGFFDNWLRTALSVKNISGTEAKRVPDVVRSLLREHGADIDFVKWGGGEDLEEYRGKVVAQWKPPREYNAVNYANMVKPMFQSAANSFDEGSRILFSHYEVIPSDVCVWCDGTKVYPEQSMDPTQPGESPPTPRVGRDGNIRGGKDKKRRGLSNRTKYIIIGSSGAAVVLAGLMWWSQRRSEEFE